MLKLRIISAACLLALSALYGQAWAKAQRVISLLPSATEAVCVLGACDKLVGVDDFSFDPPEITTLPRLGKTWQPNLEAIVQLQPDLVLAGRAPQVIQKLQALGLNVQEVDAVSVHEVHTVLQRLDKLLDTQRAPLVIEDIDQTLKTLSEEATQIPQQRVYIEVDAALYSAAPHSFIGELLAALGAQNIASSQGTAFPKLSPEYVVQHAPDLIIQTYSQGAQAIHTRPGWHSIPAIKNGRICPLTAQERRIAIRPGPRIAEAAAIFLRCLRMPYPTEHHETQ